VSIVEQSTIDKLQSRSLKRAVYVNVHYNFKQGHLVKVTVVFRRG